MRRVLLPALIPSVYLALACVVATPICAATPVTITFEDIHNKPFGYDWLPPFLWRGVVFYGGGLHRRDDIGTYYFGRGRNVIQMVFPAGSTDVSFDVDGHGEAVYPQSQREYMPIEVWEGDRGNGVLRATLPIPQSLATIFPPSHRITIAGPLSSVAIFTAEPPPGESDYWSWATVDNIRYTPPDPEPSILFDALLPAHTRVLTHDYGEYGYPSPLQTEDGAIRVQASVRVNGQPAPGRTIHFRVVDPPDASPYVRNADDARYGDNFDGPGSIGAGGQTTATAVSDASGRVSVTLRITSFAAGDNYQIEASANESFPCGASCAKSAVYTAWKRVYVEYNKMFRKGAFLTKDVPAGAKEIPVDDVSGLPNPPFEVRLLHAAKVDAPSGDFATEERVTVVQVKKDGGFLSALGLGTKSGKLVLAPNMPGLTRVYFGPEKIKDEYRAYLADAVGVVTGDRATDFLLANGTLVNSLFDQAYAEYVWLTDAAPSDPDLLFTQPRVLYDGVLPAKFTLGGSNLDGLQREWLTRKWLRHAQRQGIERLAGPNHQALFTTGRFWQADHLLGVTTVGSNFNDAWLAIRSVGQPTRLAEATAHELAHQWRVNHGGSNPNANGGHCGRLGQQPTALLMAGDSARYCLMTDLVFDHPEGQDGILGFHYKKFALDGTLEPDSEHLRIRRRAEPVPQHEMTRPEPK